ncbi:cellulase family glycosylhydrolase [Opitutus terrae]|nr:cellulase family glycosylhydrolase [Opitutus terrae]
MCAHIPRASGDPAGVPPAGGAWRVVRVGVGLTVALLGLGLHAATLGFGDGVNLQPSYFNAGQVDFGWKLMRAQPRIQTVRVEIEPSIPIGTAKRWLTEAQAQGYGVIATYHHARFNGSDSVEELLNAAKWWRANYGALRETGPLTINLMNEWGSHKQRPQSFADAYNQAIKLVREVYDGPIVVDIPGWAQETHVAREAATLIEDTNIIFSVHIYASGWVEYGPRHWMTTADLDALEASGRPVLVGEFGGRRKGRADWSALVDHARAKGWTLLAWAWNGDGEGMNMVRPTWSEKPQATRFSPSSYFRQVYSKLREPKRK